MTDLTFGPLPAMREDRGRFAALHGTRVLVYWPHGLGDWVHLGAVVPLLEPSNAYAIARFGDDYSSVMEGCAGIEVLPSGVRAPSDGSETGAAHLGLALRRCNGAPRLLEIAPPLRDEVERFAPQALLWTDYPETEGRTPYPFHTKARNLARLLVAPQRLARFDLSQPLRSALDFRAPEQSQRALDGALATFAQPGSRICIVSRTGFTAARKNWGDASEARVFAAALRSWDPRWRIVSMDDEDLGEGSAGFRALFGALDDPFARAYKALAARADLFAGVPAGPLHLTMARGGIPVVGIWLAHHPDWYDEPNPRAIHLIGRDVRDRGFDRRPASTTLPPSLAHDLRYLDTRGVSGETAFEAARSLL